MLARTMKRLLGDRKGGTAIEYGLIAALVVIAMVAAFVEVASATTGMWGNVNARVATAPGGR